MSRFRRARERLRLWPKLFSKHKQKSFDLWLEQKLDTLYEHVLAEPLPPEIEKLARRLDTQLQEQSGDENARWRADQNVPE